MFALRAVFTYANPSIAGDVRASHSICLLKIFRNAGISKNDGNAAIGVDEKTLKILKILKIFFSVDLVEFFVFEMSPHSCLIFEEFSLSRK